MSTNYLCGPSDRGTSRRTMRFALRGNALGLDYASHPQLVHVAASARLERSQIQAPAWSEDTYCREIQSTVSIFESAVCVSESG